MSFLEARIKNDLENLTIPIQYKRTANSLEFDLKIETSVYNGTFNFVLDFPNEYPFKSPKLICKTKTFHPNIDSEGHFCLKVLREGWMPTFDINSVIVSILCAFYYLSSEDALNTEAGLLLDQDYAEFLRRVKKGM